MRHILIDGRTRTCYDDLFATHKGWRYSEVSVRCHGEVSVRCHGEIPERRYGEVSVQRYGEVFGAALR